MLFAEGAEVMGWSALIGSLVQLGFSAIVGWYLLTKAIPKMQDQFLAEQKAAREKHEEGQKEARATYADSQRLQRLDYQSGLKEQREEFRQALAMLEASANRREDRAT